MKTLPYKISLPPLAEENCITPDEVIYRIHTYGVPAIVLLPEQTLLGDWTAVHQGDGKWRVKGTLVSRDRYFATVWVYSGKNIYLVEFNRQINQEIYPDFGHEQDV